MSHTLLDQIAEQGLLVRQLQKAWRRERRDQREHQSTFAAAKKAEREFDILLARYVLVTTVIKQRVRRTQFST
jgi:hypothetical protein